MKQFKKLFVARECPNCKKQKPVILELNRILPIHKRFSINNVRNTDEFNVHFFPIIKKINFTGTPHLSIGEIKFGKIIEKIRILGGYSKESLRAFLYGYLNEDFLEEYKDIYELELKNE